MISTSIWLLGAAIPVRGMVEAGNYNPGNAGVVFYMIMGPLLLFALLAYSRYAGRARAEPAASERTVAEQPR
ncbi:MAG: hypothetical protein M3M97_06705 [Actinomycetota bacterium]|nr:hypothetical protein [Actinomycetota bacterium]